MCQYPFSITHPQNRWTFWTFANFIGAELYLTVDSFIFSIVWEGFQSFQILLFHFYFLVSDLHICKLWPFHYKFTSLLYISNIIYFSTIEFKYFFILLIAFWKGKGQAEVYFIFIFYVAYFIILLFYSFWILSSCEKGHLILRFKMFSHIFLVIL